MASLTISQIQAIKEHMTDDMSMLSKKFKAKKNPYDTQTVLLNELDDYLSNGWEEVSKLKYKARIQKLKPAGRRFEDLMLLLLAKRLYLLLSVRPLKTLSPHHSKKI